jgi:hypothetical protein
MEAVRLPWIIITHGSCREKEMQESSPWIYLEKYLATTMLHELC